MDKSLVSGVGKAVGVAFVAGLATKVSEYAVAKYLFSEKKEFSWKEKRKRDFTLEFWETYEEVVLSVYRGDREEARAGKNRSNVATEELSRALGIFVERCKDLITHGEDTLNWHDTLCSLGEVVENISPKLEECDYKKVNPIREILNTYAEKGGDAREIAEGIYRGIIDFKV